MLNLVRIDPATKSSSLPETWDGLVSRVKHIFSDEFLSSLHPLSGHLRAALHREGHLAGLIPACAIAVFDATLSNLCKFIDPKVESHPHLVISHVMRTPAKLSGLGRKGWLKRKAVEASTSNAGASTSAQARQPLTQTSQNPAARGASKN